MKILCTTSSFSVDTFPASLQVIRNPYKRRLTEEEVIELIEKYQPIGLCAGVEPLTRKALEQAKSVKVISRCGIGLDSVDLEAAADLGITVYNTPDAPVVSVAEHAMGLMLGLMRHVNVIDAAMRKQEWVKMKGVLLAKKTVGILGCGRIGTYVAKLLSAFGCKLIGYDPYLQEHQYCELLPLNDVLKTADIISLHVPHTRETHYMIGAEQFKMMKPSALIINTARGGLIDENALAEALKSGKIAGAALDVFEQEPYKGSLTELPEKTLLTAHIASSAQEARMKMEQETIDNLLKGLKEAGFQV